MSDTLIGENGMEKKIENYSNGYKQAARTAVAEGCVLLKNDAGVLPLKRGCKVALFGRSQFHYYKSGTGSGGMVNTAYVTGVKEAIEQSGAFELNQKLLQTYEEWLQTHPYDQGQGWAQEPWYQEEMPITAEFAAQLATESEVAVILIGRTAGEDKDNKAEAGSYLLTAQEEEMLAHVCQAFEKTVVLLNVGNIIDMKWVQTYNPNTVMYIWQGGQEGGNGVLDLLDGTVSPSGGLADTIAYDIADYASTANYGDPDQNFYAEDIYVGYRYFSTFAPEKVMYPFGYGLSYTSFSIDAQMVSEQEVTAMVTNTGNHAGKKIVLVFAEAPQGLLGKPSRILVSFGKTGELQPGEKETLTFAIRKKDYASYDESGVTGHKDCFVLEAGEYRFYVGSDVNAAKEIGSFVMPETTVVEQLQEALAPVIAFDALKPGAKKADGTYERSSVPVQLRTVDPKERRKEHLPQESVPTGDRGIRLSDVESGKATMEEFVAQLSDEELIWLVRGEGMCSPKVTAGTAAAFGGLCEELTHYGLPAACCADGPSGIRMDCGLLAFAMPNGTCLACTFNEALSEELYEYEGIELRKNKIDTLLGPGINIHRNPLNGRNFEYFSEDPYLTGRLAAAQLRAMHRYGVTGTIKHFAGNNQEYKRHQTNSIVSQRALREIYLRGFEIAVKEGQARSIMTTYAPVNGIWTAGNYDLNTTVLREDWGYTGIVMTDWWATINEEGGTADIKQVGAMVRAQNDLYMVTGDAKCNGNDDNLEEEVRSGKVTRGELQRAAINICGFLLSSLAYVRQENRLTPMDEKLAQLAKEENTQTGPIINVETTGTELVIDGSQFDTSQGSSVTFAATVAIRGTYQIVLRARATESSFELAQIPVSVFRDQTLAGMITLNGAQKQWKDYVLDLPGEITRHTSYLKFYFGISGLEIESCKLVLTKDMDEEIQQRLATFSYVED